VAYAQIKILDKYIGGIDSFIGDIDKIVTYWIWHDWCLSFWSPGLARLSNQCYSEPVTQWGQARSRRTTWEPMTGPAGEQLHTKKGYTVERYKQSQPGTEQQWQGRWQDLYSLMYIHTYMVCPYVISALYWLLEEYKWELSKNTFLMHSSHNFTPKRNEVRYHRCLSQLYFIGH
jgi:hypothetical protein